MIFEVTRKMGLTLLLNLAGLTLNGILKNDTEN